MVERIGQVVSEKFRGGGMGGWFTKLSTRLDQFVAVKFLPDDIARNRQALEWFRRKAKAVTAVYHQNIFVLHDVGEENVFR
jgi:eukaryotic-like serine/threonine-protein kinase